ncbi:TetR/AcrR family transcriptional regulator [Paenisporosarcina sp. NPDC076898]|uniref:TetR/AcrR family transcriptional regulator n=1 Tax=unclassified Paenisporosarcina TaxID=2642018 RepID=UPI003D03A72A
MDRRHEILDAATKSFSLFGYKATTMDQVAKLANVGKGTIYTFFSNKEELFHEIVFTMINEMKAEKDAIISNHCSFQQNAHLVLMKMLEFRERHALLSKLIAEEKEMQTPIVQAVLVKVEQEIVRYIAEHIERAISNKEIRDVDVELVAYLIFKAYMAFAVDWQITHEQALPEEKIVGVFRDTIFRSLIT